MRRLVLALVPTLILILFAVVWVTNQEWNFAGAQTPVSPSPVVEQTQVPTLAPITQTAVGSPSAVLPSATPPPEPTNAPAPPTATSCATDTVVEAGELVHVIGPGDSDRWEPSPLRYVQDRCTSEVYPVDPATGQRAPTTQAPG